MADQRTKIIIETDAGRSETVLNNVKKGLQGVDSQAGKTGKGVSGAAKSIDSSLVAMGAAAAAATIALKKTFDLAKEASQLSEARLYLEAFSASIGVSFDRLEQSTRRATRGLVDDLTLIRKNHRALKMGISTDVNEIARLWEIADAVGDELGQSMEQTFDQMVTAISEGNARMLVKLGILPENFKRVSTAAGITAKRVELLNEVFKQAGPITDALAAKGDTVNDKFTRLEVSIKNLKLTLGETIEEAFIPTIDWFNEDLAPSIKDAIKLLDELKIAFKAIEAPAQVLSTLYYDQDSKKYPANVDDAREKYYQVNDRITEISRRMQEIKPSMNSASWFFDATKSKIPGMESYTGLQKELQALQKYSDELEQLIVGLDFAQSKLEKNFKVNLGDEYGGLFDEMESVIDSFDVFDRAILPVNKTLSDNSKTVKTAKTEYIDLIEATTAQYQLYRKIAPTIENLEGGLLSIVNTLKDVIEYSGASGDELLKIPFLEAAKQAAEVANSIDMIKEAFNSSSFKTNQSFAKNAVLGLQNGIYEYFDFISAASDRPMLDGYGGNIISAIWNAGSQKGLENTKDNLAQTIAEAVTTGFNNADFSNLALTLGNVISNVITSAASSNFPVFNESGGFNLGNFALNLGASAVASFITRPGRMFGGTEIHGQENISAAQTNQNTLDALWDKLGDYYLNPLVVGANQWNYLSKFDTADRGAFGYQGNKSGDGIFSDRTITYEMLDLGGSAAIQKLNDFFRTADTAIAAADYKIKTLQANQSAQYYTNLFRWYEKPLFEAKRDAGLSPENAQDYYSLQFEFDSLKREYDSLKIARQDRGFQIAMEYGGYGPNYADSVASSEWMSKRKWYGMDLIDTIIDRDNPATQPLVRAINSKNKISFELASLGITDPEAYSEKMADFLDTQIEKYQDLLDYETTIINDIAASIAEREAAISRYEQAQNAYYQAKLDQLALEQQQEEKIKRKQEETRTAKLGSLLSFVAEVGGRSQTTYNILNGQQVTNVLKEIRDAATGGDPEFINLINGLIASSEKKALWG